jgi:hypothetical protein
MIPRSAILGIAAVTLAAGPALAAGKPHNVSWGRANVSFADYNRDAQQCAAKTFGVTLHLSPQTAHDLDMVANGSLMSLLGTAGVTPEVALSPTHVHFYSTTYVETYKHATRVDFTDQLQAILDTCLAGRGYHRFRLTDAQMDQLHELAQGSAEREHFLYSLGSDPDVLAAQAI